MIGRTPPLKKPRVDTIHSPIPDLPLVPSEYHAVREPPHEASDQLICTYQCRQMVKSEFLDALNTAEKQVCDFQYRVEELNENFCTSESEKKKIWEKFLRSEQELAAANAREKALQAQLLKEVNDNREQCKSAIRSHNELEVKLRNEMNLRKNAESSAASYGNKIVALERKLCHVSEDLEGEKKRLHNELEQLQKESKLSVSRISLDLAKMECKANNAEKESKLLKDQVEKLKMRLHESLNQKVEVEQKLLSLTSQETHSTDGANILVKHLQEELRNYERDVQEARKLKSSHENIELLKDMLLEEKSRRERVESELLTLPQLEQSVKNLEDELASWNQIIKDIPDISCSEDIPLKFAALQKEVIDSMLKVGETTARLNQMEVALDSAEACKQSAEAGFVLAKEREEALKLEAMRTEKLLSLVMEEKDQLQSVINDLRRQKNVDSGDAYNLIRVQELESSLAKKGSFIKELENKIRELGEVSNRQHNEIILLTTKLNNEAIKIKSLMKDGDRLRSEVSLLESKLGHGDFSAANTKVLRMVNSLAVDTDAKRTIETLQTELQKANDKFKVIEELKSQSADAGKLVDSYISGKIVQMKEQIATLEKREERYKTVFADRISVFRRACCELFGYKIVMDDGRSGDGDSVTRFRVHSIYAETDDQMLEFEYESAGNTRILANRYTSEPDISRQVEIFVWKMNSIPAFTANLTLESFNRRTLS